MVQNIPEIPSFDPKTFLQPGVLLLLEKHEFGAIESIKSLLAKDTLTAKEQSRLHNQALAAKNFLKERGLLEAKKESSNLSTQQTIIRKWMIAGVIALLSTITAGVVYVASKGKESVTSAAPENKEKSKLRETLEKFLQKLQADQYISLERIDNPQSDKTVYYVPQAHVSLNGVVSGEAVISQIHIFKFLHALSDDMKKSFCEMPICFEGDGFDIHNKIAKNPKFKGALEVIQKQLRDNDGIAKFYTDESFRNNIKRQLGSLTNILSDNATDFFIGEGIRKFSEIGSYPGTFQSMFVSEVSIFEAIRKSGYHYDKATNTLTSIENPALKINLLDFVARTEQLEKCMQDEIANNSRDRKNIQKIKQEILNTNDIAMFVYGKAHLYSMKELAKELRYNLVIIRFNGEDNSQPVTDHRDVYKDCLKDVTPYLKGIKAFLEMLRNN